MTPPCGRWDAAANRHCGGTPTRLYPVGYRCAACTPAALAGQQEPGQTAHCPPLKHTCTPDNRCRTWTWQQQPWRVLTTGGRDRDDKHHIWSELSRIHAIHPNLTIVHGAAYPRPENGHRPDRSADWLIHLWCQQHPDVTEEAHPADWRTHRRADGPIRNAHMVKLGADECVAFPGAGPGTRDCMKKAAAAGIPVRTLLPPITDQSALFAQAAHHA
jgi:hypothetical protein